MNIFFVICGILILLILLNIDKNIANLVDEIRIGRQKTCHHCESVDDEDLELEEEF